MATLAQSSPWRLEQVTKYQGPSYRSTKKSRTLGRFRQVFPIALFPDDLLIEENRIVWILNKGPWVKEMISTMATDIASIDSSTGPILGHIHIRSLTGGPEIVIDKLPKNDVLRARFLIEGVVLSARRGEIIEKDNLEVERSYLINKGRIN